MSGFSEVAVSRLVAGLPAHASRSDKEEAVRRLLAAGRSTGEIVRATGLGKSLVNAINRGQR